MTLNIITVPCLQDNYAFLICNDISGEMALVDAPEAFGIQAALHGRQLNDILITHHHWDHVEGIDDLRANARVIGAADDAHRLPALDLAVHDGDEITVCGERCQVFHVPGHTTGHIAFYFPHSKLLFSADSLMALGCGRLFEGSAADMWGALRKLRALPDDTILCSGHEYTAANARFALSIDLNNADLFRRCEQITQTRKAGQPTVPSLLGEEKRTNPFLRADDPDLKAALDMKEASDLEVFTEIRRRKDNF